MPFSTPYDDDLVTIKTRTRVYGGWGDFELQQMTVRDARRLRQSLQNRNYDNTQRGDKVFIDVAGTLSQIYATRPPEPTTPALVDPGVEYSTEEE
jgi:hypothetical protein